MPKLHTQDQTHHYFRAIEQSKKLSAHVILNATGMVGKIIISDTRPDRDGIPGIRVFLWDWTNPEVSRFTSASGHAFGQDIETLVMSELDFNGVPLVDHSEHAGSWRTQIEGMGFSVQAVL